MATTHSLIQETSDGPARARLAGTGIEAFEVFKVFVALDEDWQRLRTAFDVLSEEQLRAALSYAAEHEAELRARLAVEGNAPERLAQLWRRYPSTRPPIQ